MQVLANQGVKPEDMGLRAPTNGDIEMEDAETAHFNNGVPDFKLFESQPLSPIHITTYYNSGSNSTTPVTTRNGSSNFAAPKPLNERKRKLLEHAATSSSGTTTNGGGNDGVKITPIPSTSTAGSVSISEKSDNSNKIRRVQNKIRSHYNNNSGNINKDLSSTSSTTPSNVIAGNNNKARGK